MLGAATYEYILHLLQHKKLRTGHRYVHKLVVGKIQRELHLIEMCQAVFLQNLINK